MVTRLRYLLAGLGLSLGLSLVLAAPALAAEGSAGTAQQAVCAGIQAANGNCTDTGNGLSKIIQVVIGIISAIAGAAAIIMVVIGGMRYITSGGDASKISSAKSAILYAVIGLVIVALAQIMVRFVAFQATKK